MTPGNPVACPADAGIAQLVERNLAKVEVASSSLVSRSKSRQVPKGSVLIRIRIPGCCTPAWWQSGYAAACKAAYAGSIPTQASRQSPDLSGLFLCLVFVGYMRNPLTWARNHRPATRFRVADARQHVPSACTRVEMRDGNGEAAGRRAKLLPRPIYLGFETDAEGDESVHHPRDGMGVLHEARPEPCAIRCGLLPRGYSTYPPDDVIAVSKLEGAIKADVERDRRLEPGERAGSAPFWPAPSRKAGSARWSFGMRRR